MKEFCNTIQLVFSAVGGWLGYFLGGCDGLLYTLLAFVVLDYVTGIMCAVSDKKLSSAVGFRGLFRKVLIFALVGVGHLLDVQILGAVGVLRTAVIFFYLSNEGVSLIENAAHLGLPIPAKLKAVLEQLHDRAEKDGEEEWHIQTAPWWNTPDSAQIIPGRERTVLTGSRLIAWSANVRQKAWATGLQKPAPRLLLTMALIRMAGLVCMLKR